MSHEGTCYPNILIFGRFLTCVVDEPAKKRIFTCQTGRFMHRILALFFSFCFLALAVEAGAQRVTDSGYRAVAFIKPDGTIQDGSYKIIGHIKPDGTVQDASYKIVAHLKGDGTVQDASYRIVGHVKDDGTVQDSSYRIIGHIKKDGTVQDASYKIIGHAEGIPVRWTAFFFFFRT